MSILETPEFYGEIELKLLAREFPVSFKAVRDEQPRARARERDEQDFAQAIAERRIQPSDPAAAKVAHLRMRRAMEQYAELKPQDRAALPADVLDDVRKDVFPSEFADYQEGVLAYSAGEHAKARAAWERLLARPEAERHYRSVHAAFMIGVLATVENWDDGPHWFELARDLASRGFHDSDGLAAASYNRESEWHARRGQWREAAEFGLRSISAGYPSRSVAGFDPGSPEDLAKYAADPLLRRIYTISLLADHSGTWDDQDRARLGTWLQAIEAAKAGEFAGAERLGWLCYSSGDYAAASRWVARAPKNNAHALWLRGKLAAREGRNAEAAEALAAAAKRLSGQESPKLEVTLCEFEESDFAALLLSDHGIAAISQADFQSALDAFLKGGHWVDAAFVAERLMKTGELRRYVESAPSFRSEVENRDIKDEQSSLESLRWLLGRRLAREGHCDEARQFFPKKWQPAIARYGQALKRATTGSREQRALALWDAALEARHHGIELLGTESGPDFFVYEGDYQEDDPAKYRLGLAPIREARYDEHSEILPLPAILKASGTERERLRASAVTPAKRFHYRYIAAELAWRAAKLLPDNDPRLAEMLNSAGVWVATRDPETADRYYQEIVRRCPNSPQSKNNWLVDQPPTTIPARPPAIEGDGNQ